MAKQNKFGTFGGVFTPSILTILGVIMYLRLPMIIGQAGLLATIGIIIVAHIISATTGLSVSSIATDKKVQAGGTYYMISRSLGLPIGGTLGLALFVGLSFSVSLYLIGFAESFLSYWGYDITKQNIQICGSIILASVTIITFISTSLAIKTQYVIMTAIGLSLLSILIGNREAIPVAVEPITSSGAIPLMVLFGIFFPAVTGFEAGVSMSGDLKDPKKSIPVGAIAAIVVGLVVYILLSIFLSNNVDHNMLANDPEVLLKISWLPQLVIAGIWGATLSSALGSILGAPRILQATAVDKITPKFFAAGTGESNEPRNALLITFLIAEAGILIGELDVIARIVSIFFITTYGFLNLSCAFESLTSADFRPKFRTPAWISIIGATACILVMIQLDFVAMVIATVALSLLFFYIRKKQLALQSGDAWAGLWASLIKTGLKRVKEPNLQTRNWRPNVIMFSGEMDERPELIEFGKSIVGKLGILSAFDLIETQDELLLRQDTFTKPDKEGFSVQKHKCRSMYEGMDEIVRAYGFLSLQPNTIFMGWSNKSNNRENFLNFVRRLDKNNFNSVFMSYNPEKGFGKHDTIDVYWSGEGNSITLVINLLRHLTSSDKWEDAQIRLLLIANDSTHSESLYKGAEAILDIYRTYMQIVVINNSIEKLDRSEIIQRESSNAALTVIGLSDQVFENFEETFDSIGALRKKMGSMIFVNASRTFEYHNILPKSSINMHAFDKYVGKSLPDLQLTIFPELNNIILEMDEESHALLSAFFNETKLCHVERLNDLLGEFEKLSEFCIKSREKIEAIPEKPKRKKALDKLQGEYLFKSKKTIELFIEKNITADQSLLSSALSELISSLEKKISRLENRVTVMVEKDYFNPVASDSLTHRLYKWRKRLSGFFSSSKIPIHVPVRNLARYFILQKRLVAMHQQLHNWNQAYLIALSSIKQIREQIQEDIIQPVVLTLEETSALSTQFENKALKLRQQLLENETKLESYIIVDNRQEINLMAYEMTKVNPTASLRAKKRPGSYYKSQKLKLQQFTSEMYDAVNLYLNKNNSEIWIDDLQYRINVASIDHNLEVLRSVNGILIQPLKRTIQALNFEDEKEQNIEKVVNDFPEFKSPQSFDNSLEVMKNEVLNFIQQLPEELPVAEFVITENGKAAFSETLRLPLRRMSQYYVESGFKEELKQINNEAIIFLKEKATNCNELVSRLAFEVDNILIKSKSGDKVDISIFTAIREKLNDILEEIQDEMERFPNKLNESVEKAFEPLSPYLIAASAKEMSHFIREYQGRQTLNKVGNRKEKIAHFINNLWVKLLYKQSQGVLLARQLSGNRLQANPQEQMLEYVTQFMPVDKVMQKVPVYYKNLFSGSSSIVADFWIERKTEQNRFNTLLQQYNAGYHGAIMILGNKNSGKTALSRFMAQKHFKPEDIYFILPPLGGNCEQETLEKTIGRAIASNQQNSGLFNGLKNGSVLIFNDIELWWENHSKGSLAIERLLEWVNLYSHKYLFIFNTSPFAYRSINKHIELDPFILGTIECLPFGAEEIRDLVMSRHRSGGLVFSIGIKRKGIPSDIRLASLFNKIFIHSGGNPGLSLYAWLAGIEKISGNNLTIGPPKTINQNIFEKLSADWIVVLTQIILHKRMDPEKLIRVLHINEQELMEIIRPLIMTGLVTERNTGLYSVNPAITHWLAQYLRNKNYI